MRRGTTGLPALAGLVPERTWALLSAVDDQATRRAAIARRLAAELHAAVPALPAGQRAALLRLRRDVHNDRPPAVPPHAVPEGCRELLSQWHAAHEAGAALLAEACRTFAADLDTARKTLAEVATGEEFQRGVQLSGEQVYREVMAYAADPADSRRKPSRRRRVESTIVSFAYRSAFKPSPFGSFTEVGAQPWDARPQRGGTGGRVRLTRLNAGLLAWMAHQLRRIEHSDRLLRIRLNNTLTVAGDRAAFVRRPIEGSDDAFSPDRVVTARNTGLVRLLVETLAGGDRTERELRDRLVAAGLDAPTAARTIDQLVRSGLCHRGLGLPDQTTRFAAAAARALDRLPGAQAQACAGILRRLQHIEDAYAPASAERRTGLLAELRAAVNQFVEVCGTHPPAEEAMRSAIYEDVGTRSAAITWQPELLRDNEQHLRLFQRLLPVLDNATVENLGLYRLFADTYGESCEGVELTSLFQTFDAMTPARAGALMSGVGDPHAERVRALRRELFDLVDDALAADPGAALLRLDPERLRAFADTLPAITPPWRSAAYRFQFAHTEHGRLAVLNGVTTGHGVFFSRFCDLLEPAGGGWSLREQLRDHIARTTPRQTDITATLGLNFNLHPRLTPLELVYPGSVPMPGARGVLTMADLVVRPDPARRRLELVSTVDCAPIELVPLNFLYPAAAPMLYRFLCAFAPTRTYRGGLWDQVYRAAGNRTPATRPRVQLGDLVLDRRRWQFPAAELPALDGLERYELGALREFDAWRLANGLPRTGFFRLTGPPAPSGGERDLIAETRRWAIEARSARLHKPHFLDTRNPFLLHILAKQAKSAAAGTVVFHECLPAASSYTEQDGPASAEEFFVEYTMDRSADAEH
ncbi:MAG TPA: lantibiotic dehydratase [Pseudonocardiaceae bacterium]|nr:lantibiotic dehydratase [Pseudonocardiaceae bacterium]